MERSGGSCAEARDSILVRAVLIITEMCRSLNKYGRESWAEAWGEALTKLMDLATEKISWKAIDIKKDIRHRTMER